METRSSPVRLEKRNYSEIVKSIGAEIQSLSKSENSGTLAKLYFNRGWCFQQLDLNRKALKDFNEAIQLGASHLKLSLHRGDVLWKLNKKQVGCGHH